MLLIFDHYQHITDFKYVDRLILYLIIQFAIVLFVFRETPRNYGFGLGDWNAGMIIMLVGIVLMTPIIWYLGTNSSSMENYYKPLVGGLPWTTFLGLIGWEFFFRGQILFGYARKFGTEALWLQAAPFALAHVGKSEIETLSTIFGGFAFGWVAQRTRSFLHPFLIHWYIVTLIILILAGVLG